MPQSHPAFALLNQLWRFEEHERWPSLTDLQSQLQSLTNAPRNNAGDLLRLVEATARSARDYEEAVFSRAELSVRPQSWHDFFNVMTWMNYPRAKAALNARHVDDLRQNESLMRRSRVRDALTTFDEDGMVIVATDVSLFSLIREFRWRELFVERRDAWHRDVQAFAFGHALLEKLLNPFVGLTAKAVLIEVNEKFSQLNIPAQIECVDSKLAVLINARESFPMPQWLSPIPVLGIPDWWAENSSASFYDNASYFRTGRRMSVQVSSTVS